MLFTIGSSQTPGRPHWPARCAAPFSPGTTRRAGRFYRPALTTPLCPAAAVDIAPPSRARVAGRHL